ncbi:MAG TPA: type II secretion system F family protein [Syntrophales bacterium]|nr:type II secretion system F family protein [Syntrophales bacterium]
MPKYSYEAINETGATVSGVIEADTLDAARNLLLSRGYIPARVTGASERGALFGISWQSLQQKYSGVSMQELILFTKQFRTMFLAGVPIMRLLEVLEAQVMNPKLKQIVTEITQDVREGSPLSDSLAKHPKTFNTLYRSMIKAGEASGTIPEVLQRLIYILEHEYKIRSDVKSALQYPIIVVAALGIAFFVLLNYVIPRFVGIFARVGVDLPWPTRVSLMLHRALTDYWFISLTLLVGLIVGLSYYLRTEQGRFVRDSIFLRIPLLGPLFVKAAMSRFASIFSILQASGVPVMNSLQILSGTIGNSAIAREFDQIKDRVEEGRGISGPLSTARFFTPMVIQMVAIGEESGQLDEMLQAVSVHYDDEVAFAVKRLSDAIGPILVVGLAFVVGFFALAIFLPMWDLTKLATKGF